MPETGLSRHGRRATAKSTLPSHLTLGPITVPTVYCRRHPPRHERGLTLGSFRPPSALPSAPFKPPSTALGVQGLLSFPGSGGNLGPAEPLARLQAAQRARPRDRRRRRDRRRLYIFRPHEGSVRGRPRRPPIEDLVQVSKVIGVIDTVMPDGSKGFSLPAHHHFRFPAHPAGLRFHPFNGVGVPAASTAPCPSTRCTPGFRAHTPGTPSSSRPTPSPTRPRSSATSAPSSPSPRAATSSAPCPRSAGGRRLLITLAIGIIPGSASIPSASRSSGLIDAGLPTPGRRAHRASHRRPRHARLRHRKTLEIDGFALRFARPSSFRSPATSCSASAGAPTRSSSSPSAGSIRTSTQPG